jgi:hypothetical protein
MSEAPPTSGMTALEFYLEELRASLHVEHPRSESESAHLLEMCRGVLIAWDAENEPDP